MYKRWHGFDGERGRQLDVIYDLALDDILTVKTNPALRPAHELSMLLDAAGLKLSYSPDNNSNLREVFSWLFNSRSDRDDSSSTTTKEADN